MGLVEHLISPATLPSPTNTLNSLSVLSYNVLLPNSVDGWWTYKMYLPPLSEDNYFQSAWDYRRSLLQQRLEIAQADVICLQEVAPESFESDFGFMQDLGYDGVELFKKGRFRPATFWKTSECELVAPAVHKDRCLLTAFRKTGDGNGKEGGNFFVCNCHLQAGKEGPRRVRQIHEAMRGAMTLARKLKEPNPESNLRLVACGDFNGGEECGAVRYLEDGFIDESFVEDGQPVSSGRKALPLDEPLRDATASVARPDNLQSPATLVVPELMSVMMEEATYENPVLSQDMLDRLRRVYETLATGEDGKMSLEDVEAWLVKINRELGRGDEYRSAAKQMGWEDSNREGSYQEQKQRVRLPEGGILTLEGFIEVYRKELTAGKFWGIAHDMAVLGDPLPEIGVFTARYDRMYHSAALQPTAVLDTVCDRPCPNDVEPSDHLPVAASFRA